MPFMYPEALAKLRADHPNLQYDGYGNVIGVTQPDSVQMAADAIYQLPGMQPDAWSFGPARADFQNSEDFVGPVQPQWWDPNGELFRQGQDLLGGFMAGRDLQRPRRAAHPSYGAPSGNPPGWSQSQQDAYVREASGMPLMQQARGIHAGAADILKDASENTWGLNPVRRPNPYRPYEAYGAPYPFGHDDGSGEYVP